MFKWLKPQTARVDWAVRAIQPTWLSSSTSDTLLQQVPEVGQTCTLRLEDGFELSRSEVWAEYLPPLLYYNGFKSADDIRAMHFCRGSMLEAATEQRTDDIQIDEADRRFLVEQVSSLMDIVEHCDRVQSKLDWSFKVFDSGYDIGAHVFDDFISLGYSAQSNWGGELVFRKTAGYLDCIYWSHFDTTKSTSMVGRMAVPDWSEKRLMQEVGKNPDNFKFPKPPEQP